MFEGVGRRSAEHTGMFLDIGQNSLNGYERNVLFRNDGGGTFTDVAAPTGADRIEDGRGLATLDVDGDGSLDLVLRNYRQPAGILRNRGDGGNWISFDLVGRESNRDAVGARVELRTAGSTQTRVVESGSGFLSASSRRQHFGLGSETSVDSVEIRWPSGATTSLKGLAGGRSYAVEEGSDPSLAATPIALPPTTPLDRRRR